MTNSNNIPVEWVNIKTASNFKDALIAHFAFLADGPEYNKLLETIFEEAHEVEIDEAENALIVHFRGGEKLSAHLPEQNIDPSLPKSYQKVLAKHANIYIENAMITLGDHGMFNEADGWFNALEDEESDLVNFDLEKIISPMMDYSDLWLYHPGEKNAYGEPVLYYLSHEGGDIDNPADCNVGSLFLRRVAESLNIEFEIQDPGNSESEAWYNSLDSVWKEIFDRHEISSLKDAKKALKLQNIFINDDFQIKDLEPLRPLSKLTSIGVGSKVLEDISVITNFPRLESLTINSKVKIDLGILAQSSKIKRLDLSHSFIEDLDFLTHLPKLKKLKINDTLVKNLSPILACKNLEILDISYTAITDISILSKLKSIENLEFTATKVEDISALSSLKKLSTINLKHTLVKTLKPLYPCKKVHILQTSDEYLNFRDILSYRAQSTMGKLEDAWLSLDIYHPSLNGGPERFLTELKNIDFPLGELSTELTILCNAFIVHCLKSKDSETQDMATLLIEAFLTLNLGSIEPKMLDEIAGNALIPLVGGKFSEKSAQLIFDKLVRTDTNSYRLLFNLSCYYASKGNKEKVLEYARASIKAGQDRTKFLEDVDFKNFLADPDFYALVSTSSIPDPEQDPKGWWNSMTEEQWEYFSSLHFGNPEELRRELHKEDFTLYIDKPKSLDPFRGLIGLKELTIVDIRTKSLDSLSGLISLDKFECEYDNYDGKVQIKSIGALADSKNLRQLRMPGHPLESIDIISQFTKLEYIYLKCVNPIKGAIFTNLVNLKSVLLYGAIDSLKGFSNKQNLHYLRLNACSNDNGFDLDHLASCPQLRDLHLDGIKVNSILKLVGLKNLKDLYLSRTFVSEEDEKAFKKAMPRCSLNFI